MASDEDTARRLLEELWGDPTIVSTHDEFEFDVQIIAAALQQARAEERKRLQYRMTDAAIADDCHHCNDWKRDETQACWWCGRVSEEYAAIRRRGEGETR